MPMIQFVNDLVDENQTTTINSPKEILVNETQKSNEHCVFR